MDASRGASTDALKNGAEDALKEATKARNENGSTYDV